MASRKDYIRTAETIAQVLSERRNDDPIAKAAVTEAFTRFAECIAWEFKADNSNFSFQRFFTATGLPLPASLEGKR